MATSNKYECFLIADFRHGLEESVQPWLIPQDAWMTLNNGYLRRGVLQKRNGYIEFARMIHIVNNEAIGALGSTHYTGTLSNIPIRAGDLSFDDGTLTITDDGDGTLSGDGSGTINYTTGVYDITFSGLTTGAVVADYDYYPGNSIVGVELYSNDATGESDLIVFDTKRAAQYDDTNAKLEEINAGADVWTGGDYDYFWSCNARSRLYITNNVDRVKFWNGTTWANLMMDIDGDGANEVGTCLFLFHYKERIVALRTTEDGTLHPQRARWCDAADHDDWTGDEYADAPANDWIMTADFVGEDLIVWFENSTWRLKYTGDSDLPFRWEQIDASNGAYAPYSGFIYDDNMVAIGPTNILKCDNMKVYVIDQKVPDAVIGMDLENFDKIYSIQIQELQQAIISYPAVGNTENTDSLCFNWEDNSWSRYDYGFNVFGYYKEGEENLTLDDIDEDMDDLEISWDDMTRQAGYPTTLGGDSNGYVYKINYGGDDDGSAIDFSAISGRWNPYLKEGKKARLGWIEFLVDRDPSITVEVTFYAHIDGKEEVVATQDVTFGESGENAEKVWVRADCGAIGDFHRIKIRNNEIVQTLRIHSMRVYFKRAGGL